MRFHLSESLLSALRQRRDQQQLQRAKQGHPASRPRSSPLPNPSLIENVKALFSTTEPDMEQSARAYVNAIMDLRDEIEKTHDAFLIYPGMGPMLYITADGRVLEDPRSWDGEGELHELPDASAISALVIGAKNTGITALLDLIPRKPAEGQTCTTCDGRRWEELQPGSGNEIVCSLCGGHGWIAQ